MGRLVQVNGVRRTALTAGRREAPPRRAVGTRRSWNWLTPLTPATCARQLFRNTKQRWPLSASQPLLDAKSTIRSRADEEPELALPGRLSGVLEMVKPRDKRSVEHLLHACHVGLDGSAGEGFGGLYVSAGRRSCEHPFV